MRQKIATMLALLIVIACTACSSTEKVSSSAGGEMRGSGSGGTMPQGEHHASGSASSSERSEGVKNKSQKTDEVASNSESGEKFVTGKVKSIVGNEVVLIITQSSLTENKNLESETTKNEKASLSQAQETTAESSESSEATQAATIGNNKVENEAESQPETETQVTETYLLPVGMTIGSKDFSSVKTGNTLKIYFGTDPDDGSEIITAVELRS